MPIRTVGRFPDAVQRDNGAPLIRDCHKRESQTIPVLQRITMTHARRA
jgi:hypothetical protein